MALMPWHRSLWNPVRRPSLRGIGGILLAVLAIAVLFAACGDGEDYRVQCPDNGGPCTYVAVTK